MLDTYERHSKRKLAATVLTIVVIAGIVLLADHLKSAAGSANLASQTAATNQSTTPSATDPTSSSTSTSSGSYKDGNYSASSDYYVPHGDESIEVDLTLSDGVITDVSIKNSENDRDSAAFQEEFASAYKNYVVGKKISGLQLSIIAGASDTTQGFNDAISQIASKAQA